MRAVKVKFHRTDVFNQLFNNADYINNNKELIIDYSNDSMNFKDDVKGNTEQDARNNILLYIKNIVDGSQLIEQKACDILINQSNAQPTILHVHVSDSNNRTICEIIEVKDLQA